jgi:hypothetical protein
MRPNKSNVKIWDLLRLQTIDTEKHVAQRSIDAQLTLLI